MTLPFNSLGYNLQNGWINAANATINIVTNQSATIGSTLSSNVGGGTLVKSGSGTLTITGTNFISNVQVNSGEYAVGNSSSLFFSDVTLADSPGVTVTLGQSSTSASIHSLSGGGILQPSATARTVTAIIWAPGVFSGVAQDNGSGVLGLTIFAFPAETITLAGQNTYSGATFVQDGTLALSQNGSALNSAVNISQGGTLQLDNSALAVTNRLSDTNDVTMQSGQFKLIGNSSTNIEEKVGNLKFSGSVAVSNMQPGSAASLLTFAGATRQNHATIDISGTGRTKWTELANDSMGIVGAYATAANEWATVAADGAVSALATYANDLNNASATDHVKIIGSGTTMLSASAQLATLNLQNNGNSTGILNINTGQALTLGDGGILSSGTAASQIQGGNLIVANGELVVTNRNALTISSGIAESMAGTGLTKNGAGLLTLSGNNTYSGITAINQGTLLVSSDANLGTGSTIEFNGGTLKAAQSFSSTKNLTRGTDLIGTIDTAGFNLTFSGSNVGGLSKTGAGNLTLTNPAAGTVFVNQGTLSLPNATSGYVDLAGGTLQAAGILSTLTLDSSSSLDIGGAGAATLTTQSFSFSGGSRKVLTVRFGLGISASDLWNITSIANTYNISAGAFLFDFQNLGGATAGTTYTLINVQAAGPALTSADFGFTPAAIAAGWNGTFNVSSSQVTVHLTATPEPNSLLLLALGGLGFFQRRRRN